MTDLTKVPPELAYRGPPHPALVRILSASTWKDSQDRLFYRHDAGDWKRLEGAAAYEEFNRFIDRYRAAADAQSRR